MRLEAYRKLVPKARDRRRRSGAPTFGNRVSCHSLTNAALKAAACKRPEFFNPHLYPCMTDAATALLRVCCR